MRRGAGRVRRQSKGRRFRCSCRPTLNREPGRILREASPIGATGMVIWDGRFRVEGQMGAEVMAAGQFGNIQRRKDLPAFVNAGLPVVCLNKALISVEFKQFLNAAIFGDSTTSLGKSFHTSTIRFT